ncbi:unnamed protein product [Sympodiomycopsis kandeliae]
MSGQAINSIATILKRLEAATSRLEDLAATPSGGDHNAGIGAPYGSGVASSTSAATLAPSASGPVAAAESEPADSPAVSAWDDYLDHQLKEYVELSEKVGGLVATQAQKVLSTFAAQRKLIQIASASAKPSGGASSPVFANLLKPLQEPLMAVTEIRESNRAEKVLFNHLSAVSEGIPAVGWVAVEPKPGPFVSEMKDSAQFYTNRVIKEFKEKDRTHVEWCRSFIKVLDVLKEYIMKHHTTGLTWNPNGGDAAAYRDTGSSAPSAPSAEGIPPPPPPPPADFGAPPPPPAPPAAGAAPVAAAGGMDAVFSQLNKGEGITSGLKKVDSSQMTHKNPSLRGAGGSQAAAPSSGKPTPPRPGSKPASLRPKKPAQTALEGNKWNVENHENNREIVIDATELNHTVNIFGCKNCVIQIKGKINAVAMVSCQKTSILLDTLVSSLEITSSPSFAVQILGRTPTVILDSCDSGQVYLSKDGLDTELITAKCSAINVSVPKAGGEEGEYTELALPEQLKFSVANGSLKSEVVAHSG